MIFLNGDILDQKRYGKAQCVPYKGHMSHTLLAIEDVIDLARPKPDNHLCICKCLACGQIYPRPVAIKLIRENKAKCFCEKTSMNSKYKFFEKRGEMLKFLVAERNRVNSEAIFAEDEERVRNFDTVIKFLQSKSLKTYFNKCMDLRS